MLSGRVTGQAAGSVSGCSLRRATSLGVGLGFAGAVAVALDGDHISVMDDAIDERGRASGIGEDARPVAEREVGGQDGAFLLVAGADDLRVGISAVEGEKADFIEDE